ncbi:hypothetical protein [Marinobacter changyiensis]|uniref:hypothetical protein n=1 Tax=Marinobacter changyiensis TaxID=2604091 RepID=UPI0015D15FAC|nr:hypothetical protein [Marinobacter changyiensis]
MNAPARAGQVALLSRLYDLKQKQLTGVSRQSDNLRYRVLEAEAQAIQDAMKSLR